VSECPPESPISRVRVASMSPIPPRVKEEAPSQNAQKCMKEQKCCHEARHDPKTRFTVLARTNSNLADRPTDRTTEEPVEQGTVSGPQTKRELVLASGRQCRPDAARSCGHEELVVRQSPARRDRNSLMWKARNLRRWESFPGNAW
jgi:hypothetical protein